MTYTSTKDKKFLSTLELWTSQQPEVLVLIRYSRAAGSKSFEFFSSFRNLAQRLLELPPATNIIAYKQPQLPLRGVVDDAFIERCINTIPDATEFLVVETIPTRVGKASWFHDEAGESHQELRAALEDSRGKPVAVGTYPPWGNGDSDVISGIVPDDHDEVRPGVY
jgi:hypothetical protein